MWFSDLFHALNVFLNETEVLSRSEYRIFQTISRTGVYKLQQPKKKKMKKKHRQIAPEPSSATYSQENMVYITFQYLQVVVCPC